MTLPAPHRRWSVAVVGLAASLAVMPGCARPARPRVVIDDLLHWTGPRHQTLGPTGKRMFTERLDDGPGFRGQFSYIHYADIRDPLHVSFLEAGEPLAERMEQTDWYPSHLRTRWAVGRLSVDEVKFIADDDTLVNELRITNASVEPLEYRLQVRSGFASALERKGSTFLTVDLRDAANVHPWPGGDMFGGPSAGPFRLWFEAETPRSVVGSAGSDPRPAASLGRTLGIGFGERHEDRVAYEFATPALFSGHLYVRVARGEATSARWQVELDDKPIGRIEIPPTGGWGDRDEEFRWLHLGLGELLPGGHSLRLRPDPASRGENRAGFDGFWVVAQPFEPPASGVGEVVARDRFQQVAYRPGRRVVDGVPFNLIDPEENGGRGVVAPPPPGPQNTLGELVLSVPSAEADVIHFYGQVLGQADQVRAGEVVAEYELQFSEGPSERILLTGWDVLKPPHAGLSVLSHPLSRDRDLRRVVVRSRGGPGRAVLAAATLEVFPGQGPEFRLTGSGLFRCVRAHGVIDGRAFEPLENAAALHRAIRLEPGQRTVVRLAMGMAEDLDTAERLAMDWQNADDALERHQRTYQAWFDDNCPVFTCDNPWITRLYWYRWFVARHCLSRAAAGNLPFPYFFEGTHEPHFPRLVSFSSPHIIAETRWLRDPTYAFGQVRNHCLNPDPTDRWFRPAWCDEARGHYNHWIARAAWEAFWVHPDQTWLREVLSGLASDVLGTMRRFDRDGDGLCAPLNHGTTGMEFQPSFFYFNDYDNTRPDARLERGDFAAYTYGNAVAVAEAYRMLKVEDQARRFGSLAERIRDACLARLWDDEDRFFYAVREDDDEKARVREVVGFYPFAFGLVPDDGRYTAMLSWLVDPAEFWTPFPPATVAMSCPAYTPRPVHWPAAGGRTHGCMWNGPAWPHATSIMLDVCDRVIRDYRQDIVRPAHFWRMFDRYTHMQFQQDELERPIVREYAHGLTGQMIGCPDCFHSTYCDLVIRHLVGVRPANQDVLTVDPMPGGPRRFSLHNLRFRGHDVDLVYNAPGSAGTAGGMEVWIDGRWAGRRTEPGPMVIPLAPPGGR